MSAEGGECDIAVVGGGILGLAVARELIRRRQEDTVVVLERERELAQHQTGHNSGVVHAGIYYAPGSLKARLCVEGARDMYAYCEEHGIPFERRGKLIVARNEGELGRLEELERRGRENRVPGLRRLDASGLREIEPHARGVAALHSPETGVVDFAAVARSLAADLERDGGRVQAGCEVTDIEQRDGRVRLVHSRGETRAGFAVFCAGVWADELAVKAGADPDPRIVPFRGAYLRLRPEKTELVRGLIYPVPDPAPPLPRRSPQPAHRRARLAGAERAARAHAPRPLARLAGHVADGAPLVAHRGARAEARREQPQLRPRGRRLRSGASSPATSAAGTQEPGPRRSPGTAASWTTSCSRRPSARSTCETRRRPPPPHRSPSPGSSPTGRSMALTRARSLSSNTSR